MDKTNKKIKMYKGVKYYKSKEISKTSKDDKNKIETQYNYILDFPICSFTKMEKVSKKELEVMKPFIESQNIKQVEESIDKIIVALN